MKNTRTIYFSFYSFVYSIQVKSFLKISWRKCILGLDSNAAFAAKWLKIYKICSFVSFSFKINLFTAFKAFAAEWPLHGHPGLSSLKKYLCRNTQLLLFFLSSKVPSSGILCPFHSFLYYVNLQFFLVGQNNVTPFTHCHIFPSMFMKLVLCSALSFDVIFNWKLDAYWSTHTFAVLPILMNM